jgi:hypothetical protein
VISPLDLGLFHSLQIFPADLLLFGNIQNSGSLAALIAFGQWIMPPE